MTAKVKIERQDTCEGKLIIAKTIDGKTLEYCLIHKKEYFSVEEALEIEKNFINKWIEISNSNTH